jgi:hypothetical protein
MMAVGTMKRKLKWTAVVLVVSLLGFGTALFLWPRDRITVESWQKIQIGMTEEEVAEILGGPGMGLEEYAAEYARRETELGRQPFTIEGLILEERAEYKGLRGLFLVSDRDKLWTGRRGRIVIRLDQDNDVCWKGFHGVRWVNRGILDRLRDWLGW